MIAATVYASFNAWLLYLSVTRYGHVSWQLGVVCCLAVAFYLYGWRRSALSAG